MPQTVEFFFDFSCPFAYLAAEQVRDVCGNAADIELKPFLLGGVFNALDHQPMQTMVPSKARHNLLDMHRWARLHDIDFAMPAAHPMRTVSALRMLLAVPREKWWTWIDAVYAAYWVQGLDITDLDVLTTLASESGLDASHMRLATSDQAIKDELRQRTDEAFERGVFGAPAFFVNDQRYWGQDRLMFVADQIGQPRTLPVASESPADHEVEFYFDFSSPWSYLGSTQIDDICARQGATLTWRPMLLGAIFKMVGSPNVPLLAMPRPKQELQGLDLERFSQRWDVPFVFRTEFPVRTVSALRLVLLAQQEQPEQVGALIHRLYRATWVENGDINALDALRGYCRDVGVSQGLVDRLSDPEVKAMLFAATESAVQDGVFGAPSVRVDGGEPFWGQDRLPLVEAILRGDMTDIELG